MAVFKCKMCGGDLDVTEGVNVIECEYCGTNQTVPSADNEKKTNLFNRANRLRISNDFDKAAGVYESIAAEFPEEAEAYWGLCLCKYGIEYVDDPKTAKKIPTCHRTSFESIFNDSNFELALEYADPVAISIYRSEAKEIDRIQKSILEIVNKEEPFDVFICYKETAEDGQRTKDSVLAQDMYDALTAKGYKVFFSRITLEDKLGQEYEPYIFSALNSAKIMLAVGTKYEYYNAVWVKNEWSRFLDLMKNDKKKVLIPCYADIDAYDMPQEFKNLQGQDMGKIGFIQDLVRGIGKIIPIEAPQPAAQAVQFMPANMYTGQTEPLLKRAFMFLKDKDWKSADEYCEKVLDIDPECGKAYLGKLMAKLNIPDIAYFEGLNFFEKYKIRIEKMYEKAYEYGDEEIRQIFKDFQVIEKSWDIEKFLEECKVENGVVTGILVNKESITDLVIPQYITAIGDNAFSECPNLKSVLISDGVTSIGKYSFAKCKNLTWVELPKSITSINDSAFSGCTYLTSITIPENVKRIGEYAFEHCTSLKSITIPENVKKVSAYAFEFCTNLKSVTICNGIKTIGKSSFLGCTNLTSVALPESLMSIDEIAFAKCTNLTSITLPNSVKLIGNGAFFECTKLASITLSESLTSMGKGTFWKCTSLTAIAIPESITSIDSCVFIGCTNLTSVTLSNSLISIGRGAFLSCQNLKSITLSNNLTSIGEGAFFNCRNLKSIELPDNLTSISELTFGACKNLASITIPNSIISIGNEAFDQCISLTSIAIPESVKSIGKGSFKRCDKLETLYVSYDLYDSMVKEYGKKVRNDRKEEEKANEKGTLVFVVNDNESIWATADGNIIYFLINNEKMVEVTLTPGVSKNSIDLQPGEYEIMMKLSPSPYASAHATCKVNLYEYETLYIITKRPKAFGKSNIEVKRSL